jgi:hypothetical protein
MGRLTKIAGGAAWVALAAVAVVLSRAAATSNGRSVPEQQPARRLPAAPQLRTGWAHHPAVVLTAGVPAVALVCGVVGTLLGTVAS